MGKWSCLSLNQVWKIISLEVSQREFHKDNHYDVEIDSHYNDDCYIIINWAQRSMGAQMASI
jgi:hypothetical protein